jgi:hypothetical protein
MPAISEVPDVMPGISAWAELVAMELAAIAALTGAVASDRAIRNAKMVRSRDK